MQKHLYGLSAVECPDQKLVQIHDELSMPAILKQAILSNIPGVRVFTA